MFFDNNSSFVLPENRLHSIRIESFPGCRLEASSASPGHHSATVARDLQFFLCGDNLNLVCGEAKELKTVGS